MIYFSDFGTVDEDDLADLFANGETGDWWRFDNENTNAASVGSGITEATGIINGRLLEDADPSHAPTLQQPGGNYAARFDGNADRLVHNFGSAVAQPGTIIICVGSADSNSTRILLTGSSTSSRWQISADSSANIIAYAGTSLDSTINTPIGTRVLGVEFNGASSKWYIDGSQTATGSTGTGSTNQLTIGALWDGTLGLICNVYSVLFINRVLTADERARVVTLFGSHAGLSL